MYPSPSNLVNRELCKLLIYLKSSTVVDKTLKLLTASPLQEDQLHYGFALRTVTVGWSKQSRQTYFSWLNQAEQPKVRSRMPPG